ncbi:hypothetical protein BTR23_09695 [Alkalihalophilus pseudofirmus]|nr:hypothetical protein BTR23_09695 [Alkalihalophilus pseudofirmus]
MRNGGYKSNNLEGNRRSDRYKNDQKTHHPGAKTFRRGRAIAFLEMMNLKRSTLKKQLDTPELQSIKPILVGELKAIDMVINEFRQLFEIHESEVLEKPNMNNEESETSIVNSNESFDNK